MATHTWFDMTKEDGTDIDEARQLEQVGLQVVVGDLSSVGATRPNTNDYAMDFGYKECAKKEQHCERSGESKGPTSASSSTGTARALKKQKTDAMASMPRPRKPFEDELITANMMREIEQAREQRSARPSMAPPQQTAALADAPVWLAKMGRMFDKQGRRMEGLFGAQDRRISMLEDTVLSTATKKARRRASKRCWRETSTESTRPRTQDKVLHQQGGRHTWS